MDFTTRTKFIIADSIKELMKTIPLDKITVTEIVEHSSLTRQTFYRYFKDKYDLVTWYFDKIVQKTIKQMGVSMTLHEGLIKKFEYMIEDKAFFTSALSSSDYNNLMDYDYRCIFEFYKNIAKANGPLTDEIIFLLSFYCHGSMDMTAEWVHSGMQLSPEEMATRLVKAMPQQLDKYLKSLISYHQTN